MIGGVNDRTVRAREGAAPMSRAEEFRKNADKCRQQAAKAINHLDKERWLKIAEHWLQMAQEAEADPDTKIDRHAPNPRAADN